jgi:hypothetical protein
MLSVTAGVWLAFDNGLIRNRRRFRLRLIANEGTCWHKREIDNAIASKSDGYQLAVPRVQFSNDNIPPKIGMPLDQDQG